MDNHRFSTIVGNFFFKSGDSTSFLIINASIVLISENDVVFIIIVY